MDIIEQNETFTPLRLACGLHFLSPLASLQQLLSFSRLSELSGTLTPRYFPCSLDIPLYNAKVCAHEAKKVTVSKRGLALLHSALEKVSDKVVFVLYLQIVLSCISMPEITLVLFSSPDKINFKISKWTLIYKNCTNI